MSKWEIFINFWSTSLAITHIILENPWKSIHNYNSKWIPVFRSVITAVLQLHELENSSKSSRKVKVHIPQFHILFLKLIKFFYQDQTGHCFHEGTHIWMLHPSDLHFQQDWLQQSSSGAVLPSGSFTFILLFCRQGLQTILSDTLPVFAFVTFQ